MIESERNFGNKKGRPPAIKLTAPQADAVISGAQRLGVEVRLDPPHPGTPWNVEHLNIGSNGQVHLEVPKGYTNPTVPVGSATRPQR
jgi:hypothetical protein